MNILFINTLQNTITNAIPIIDDIKVKIAVFLLFVCNDAFSKSLLDKSDNAFPNLNSINDHKIIGIIAIYNILLIESKIDEYNNKNCSSAKISLSIYWFDKKESKSYEFINKDEALIIPIIKSIHVEMIVKIKIIK